MTDWTAKRDKLYKEQKLKTTQVDTAVRNLFEGSIHLDQECASYPRPEADDLLAMKNTGVSAVFNATKVLFWIEKYYNLRRIYLALKEEYVKLQKLADSNHEAYMALVAPDRLTSQTGEDDEVYSDHNIEDDERNFPVRSMDVNDEFEGTWP